MGDLNANIIHQEGNHGHDDLNANIIVHQEGNHGHDDLNANIIVHQEGNHGHDEDIDVIKTDEFKQQLRENIIVNPIAPTKRYTPLLL